MASPSDRPEEVLPAAPTPPVVQPKSLFDYEQRITEVMDELSELIPEDQAEPETDEQRARREALEALVAELIVGEGSKIDATAAVYRRLGKWAEECREESKRQAQRAKRYEGKLARLGGYLLDVMMRWGAKRLESQHNTFGRQQNPDTVEVDDAKALPFEYQRVTFTFTPSSAEQFELLKGLLDSTIEGSYEIAAAKKPLLDLVKRVEKRNAQELGVDPEKVPAGTPVEVIPEGVRLKPGTWRLTLK